jgi:hypothetical protein
MPAQTSLIGVITWRESNTDQLKSESVYKVFWAGGPEPTEYDMMRYLREKGFTHLSETKYSYYM